jgi:peptide/nickel transport system permease protein
VFAFLVRRVAYGLAILAGINLVTFLLFFQVNSPDDMARLQLGGKRVTAAAILQWKAERGYDRPLYVNERASGLAKLTDTVFFDSSLRMFAFDFGRADSGRDIGTEVARRAGPSLRSRFPSSSWGSAFPSRSRSGSRFSAARTWISGVSPCWSR